jgi:hypothetical protein
MPTDNLCPKERGRIRGRWSAHASLSQRRFSFESIRRFRAVRTAEQAMQLVAMCASMFLLSFLAARNELGAGGEIPIH